MITERDIVATMLDVPHSFEVDGEHFFLYQPSLAKVYITSKATEELNLNAGMIDRYAILELLQAARNKRRECCRLIAYNTFNRKSDILNPVKVNSRTDLFMEVLSDEDIATLAIVCISTTPIKDMIKFLKIDEDDVLRQRVMNAKSNSNTYVFGGKSLYGTLISSALEKYHWTYDYVLWDISYANLQLLLADSVSTIYLTDEERKKCCLPPANAKKMKVTTKEDIEQLKRMFS